MCPVRPHAKQIYLMNDPLYTLLLLGSSADYQSIPCLLPLTSPPLIELTFQRGWSGGAKVSCILCHRGVQLILAYSWARPAIVEVGKGRGGMFLFLLFLPFHSCSSFFPVPLFHFYLFSHFLWETTQNGPQGLTCR